MPSMSSEKLKRAIEYIRQGEIEVAQEMILGVIEEDPSYEKAWIWLVETVPTQEEKIDVLKACLDQNPDSALARKALTRLSKLPPPKPAPMVYEEPLTAIPSKEEPPSTRTNFEDFFSSGDGMVPTEFETSGIHLADSEEAGKVIEEEVGEIASEDEMLDFFKSFSLEQRAEDGAAETAETSQAFPVFERSGEGVFSFDETEDEAAPFGTDDFFLSEAEPSPFDEELEESADTAFEGFDTDSGGGAEELDFLFDDEEEETAPGYDASQQTEDDWLNLNQLIGADEAEAGPASEEDLSFLFTDGETDTPERPANGETSPFLISEDELDDIFGAEEENHMPQTSISEPAFSETGMQFLNMEEPIEEAEAESDELPPPIPVAPMTDLGDYLYEEPETKVDDLLDLGNDLRQEVMGPPAARAAQAPRKPSPQAAARKKKKENQTFIIGIAILGMVIIVSILGMAWFYWQSLQLASRSTPTPVVSPTEEYTLVAPWLNESEATMETPP
ncbi:MAG: hypothetical protein JW750_02245, partial [Anaerolineaceae bacterium]|nr:hypothetical protein [Anaerolineaceae bacterium]